MNWLIGGKDKGFEEAKNIFDLKVSKYGNLTAHINVLINIEKNYTKALNDLSRAIKANHRGFELFASTFTHLAGLIDTKASSSQKLAEELEDIVKGEMHKFFTEFKFGLQNIFRDLKVIDRRVEDMKNDYKLSESQYNTTKTNTFVDNLRKSTMLHSMHSEQNQGKQKEKFLYIIQNILKDRGEFDKQLSKIKRALKTYDKKYFEFIRELIMKMYIHQISALKNQEYDVNNAITLYKETEKYEAKAESAIDNLKVPNEEFFEEVKKSLFNVENAYLFTEVRDEQFNVYDLSIFAKEASLLNRLFDNSEIDVKGKAKLRSLAESKKKDAGMFFLCYLDNIYKVKNKIIHIKQENFDFIKASIMRPLVRKFIEDKNQRSLFRLVKNWQHIKVITEVGLESVKKELINEAFIKDKDLWFESLHYIFEPYKNQTGRKESRALLIKNYKSCQELLGPQIADSIFEKVLELKLGVDLGYIKKNLINEGIGESEFIFYLEDSLSRKMAIFGDK